MITRARLVLGVLLFLYIIVVARAFHIQVLGMKGIRERGAKQYGTSIPLMPKRGVILDRMESELAVSVSTKSIYVQSGKLKDPQKAAAILD